MKFVILSLVVGAAAARGNYGGLTNANGTPNSNQNENPGYRNGQPASAAYTAGGTSKPCTGLYCQDNPIGNPCPCPVWKPCKHMNVGDGHCMKPVNIAGRYEPCAYRTDGTWTAVIAGKENLGERAPVYGLGEGMPKGNCMCTAGSEDIYQAATWKVQCDAKNPRWCETVEGVTEGNACPPEDCEYWWGQWSDCSKSCQGGVQTRTPNVTKQPRHGGKACPGPETRVCNDKACPTPAPTPAPTQWVPPVGPPPAGPCVCQDVAKVNGRWPPNYVPCHVRACQKKCGGC